MGDEKIRIGVIGCGLWGPNHVRNFSALPGSEVVAIADTNPDRLRALEAQYKSLVTFQDYTKLLAYDQLDAVVVATPTGTHAPIVRDALLAGRHVLCEKPLCERAEEGEELAELAERRSLLLMVGHVFLFNHGILRLKEFIQSGQLGRLYYITAKRTNLGPIRGDVNSVYDLAAHDISIMNFLLDEVPERVSAMGQAFLQERIEDVVFISMQYPGGVLAHLHASWLDPKKVREITVVGDQKMVTWDDLAAIGPVSVYNKGIVNQPYYEDFGKFQLLVREGDVTIPHVRMEEPLKVQAQCFLSYLRGAPIERGTVREGIEVVRVIEAIMKSLAAYGAPVTVNSRRSTSENRI